MTGDNWQIDLKCLRLCRKCKCKKAVGSLLDDRLLLTDGIPQLSFLTIMSTKQEKLKEELHLSHGNKFTLFY